MLLSDGREAGVWGDPERMVGPPDSVGSNLVCGIRPSSCNATIALEFDNYISNGLGDDLRIWGVSLRDNHLAIVCGFEGHEFEIILTPVSGSAALSVSFGPDDWRCNRGDGHWNFDLTDVGVPVSSQLYAIEIRFSLTISTGITRASPHGFEVLNGAY